MQLKNEGLLVIIPEGYGAVKREFTEGQDNNLSMMTEKSHCT